MKLIFILSVVLLVACVNGSVLKPGRKSKVSVADLRGPMGVSLKKSYYWQVIFPGTKWCGDGDIAEDYDDLGEFINTDKCCRTHDHCDDFIPAGESKHGLENTESFTRSHCKCDLEFFDCLGQTGCKAVSGLVGTTYFNVLGEQCFDLKHPATCLEYDDILGLRPRCIKYDYDMTKPEEWQWFDVPRWILGPDEDSLYC